MATILIEGFDKYGPAGVAIPAPGPSLNMGRWSSLTGYLPSIVSGLAGLGGYAMQLGTVPSSFSGILSTTLPANYSRLIGGFRFTTNLGGYVGCTFYDNTTSQCSILVQPTSGLISIYTGLEGTLLAMSSASVAANTVHYIEFDITFGIGTAGGYTVWLDGVQVLSGTGTTITSAHTYANVFQLCELGYSANTTSAFDDLYLFDSTTAFNNAALLSNPTVVTQFPIGDHQKQFGNIGSVFGNSYCGNSNPTYAYILFGNNMYLMPFTPNVNCTINSIGIYPCVGYGGTSGSANFKGLLYADSAGLPGALLSGGTQVTGCSSGQLLTMPLATPQVLVAGTQYWLGLMGDTAVYMQDFDGLGNLLTTKGYVANNTYSSGAPTPAPSMTPGQATLCVFGICTGAATNWESEALNPPIGDMSAVSSATPLVEDLYTFPAVPTQVGDVYSVGVSGNAKLTYASAHTIELLASSSGVSGAGSRGAQTPTLNYAWYDTYFDVDPNTSAPWTPTAVSAGFYGMVVAS